MAIKVQRIQELKSSQRSIKYQTLYHEENTGKVTERKTKSGRLIHGLPLQEMQEISIEYKESL